MFIERLLNQGNAPLIEQAVRFSAARQKLLTENVANVDTPGYIQKDLSVSKFREELIDRLEQRRFRPPGMTRFNDIMLEPEESALEHCMAVPTPVPSGTPGSPRTWMEGADAGLASVWPRASLALASKVHSPGETAALK